MRYKYLLVDWDGCVIDSLNLWRREFKKRLTELGLHVTDKEVVSKAMGQRGVAHIFGLDVTELEFWDPIRQRVERKIAETPVLPGVKSTLTKLYDNGVKIGVVTSSAREIFDIGFRNRSIARLFADSVTGTDVKNLKPDPEAVNLLMSKLDATRDESLVVGDSFHDVGAGKNADVDTCLFYPKQNHSFYKYKDLLETQPTFLIEQFSDLLDIVGLKV